MKKNAWRLCGLAVFVWGASIARAAVLFQDDVEHGTNGWTLEASGAATSTLWHITDRNASQGGHSWWCASPGRGTYADGSNVVNSLLTSPDIALGAIPAVFAFRESFLTESGIDDCRLLISTNAGAGWQTLSQCRWGSSAGWNLHVLDLTPFTGATIRVRFQFSANSYMNDYAGWFIDDLIAAEKTDADLDGLFDFEEAWWGADPALPDTDGDQLIDGAEAHVAGTDPADAASCLQWGGMDSPTGETVEVRWTGSPGKLYWVEAAPLLTGVWAAVSGVVTAGVMNPQCVARAPTPAAGWFYRLASTDRVALATMGFGCDTNGCSQLYTNAFVVWGDLHAHTTYSDDASNRQHCLFIPAAALSNTVGLLDFVAITDHAETNVPGFYTMEKWTGMVAQIIAFQNTHTQMVVFPGFEYTKTWLSTPPLWPVPDGNGHKNIILYDFEHLPARGYGQDVFFAPTQLWAYLDSSNAAGHYLCIPHHPAKGSEPGEPDPWFSMATDWGTNFIRKDMLDLVEVYSRHGGSEMESAEEPVHNFQAIGAINTALDRWLLSDHNPAYKLGIIGSTDTHGGNPGDVREDASNVQSWLGDYTGGLAALQVTNRSRDALWYSLKSKNCYGTSGGRLAVEFTAKLGSSLAPMGGTLYHAEELSSNQLGLVNLHLRASGSTATNPIARIQLYRNSVCILDATNALWGQTVHLDHIDRLAHNYAYYRAKVWEAAATLNPTCQYERAWTSPIWIEKQ